MLFIFFFFQAEDGIRDGHVTGVQTCALSISGSVPFENEQRARGKDGKYRWFLIRYKPLLDETGQPLRWYASGTDIDDLKRAEAKLRHDERELRQLVDSLPQHVLVLDAQGSILQVNQMMLDYLGRTLKEM